jgi:hypothetical protein
MSPLLRCAIAATLTAAALSGAASTAHATDVRPDPQAIVAAAPMRGVALGLHFQQPSRTYESLLWEIAASGAGWVSLVVSWSQRDVRAVAVAPRSGESPPDADVERAVASAHALGLKVMIFPIVALEQRAQGEWRGRLAPTEPSAWFESYGRFVAHYADLSSRTGVAAICVGSELGSMQGFTSNWQELIRDVRSRFGGLVTYSANWDNYRSVAFWPDVDLIGVTAYHELSRSPDVTPEVAQLVATWRPIVSDLRALSQQWARPVLITEAGYVSQTAAARFPWDYTRTEPVDLAAQLRLYDAFREAWSAVPELGGVFIWNWFGEGGARDNGYSPRGKPAEGTVRQWFGGEPTVAR